MQKKAMDKKFLCLCIILLLMAVGFPAHAGPYTEAGINRYDAAFTGWATGWVDYSPSPASIPELDGQYIYGGGVANLPPPSWQNFRTPENTTGISDGAIVSLGDLSPDQIDDGVDPGEITLTFDSAITNGGGYDFAVFENGFESGGGLFAELGYVDVSTDGVNFARFDSDSLTPGPVGGYGVIDPTDVHNLMGKHPRYSGTGFDLDDLLADSLVLSGLVDLDAINYVRVVDIPGSGDFSDAQGDPIYDPYETWGSGGVDLDAVGVINAVPVPAAVWLLGSGLFGLIGIRRRNRV